MVRSRRPSVPCHLPGGSVGVPCPHDGMGGSPLCRCYWLGRLLSGPSICSQQVEKQRGCFRLPVPEDTACLQRTVALDGAGAGDGHSYVRLAQVLRQSSCLGAKALHLDK